MEPVLQVLIWPGVGCWNWMVSDPESETPTLGEGPSFISASMLAWEAVKTTQAYHATTTPKPRQETL